MPISDDAVLVAEVRGRPGCKLCEKAVQILSQQPGMVVDVLHDDVDNADVLADFAMAGRSPLQIPLVRIFNAAGVVVRHWNGDDVSGRFTELVRAAAESGWQMETGGFCG